MEVDSLSSSHPVSTPVEIPVHLRDVFDKTLPRYIHTLRRISANSLQDRVDEYCFLGPSVCQQEELSSAGMSEDREDTESAPLQSERDIDEVEVDQPNPSKAIGEDLEGERIKKYRGKYRGKYGQGLREGILGEVLEGKRIKKTVERLNFQRHIIIPQRYSKVENGRGVKLGDIPWISDHILKMHRSDLKPLHLLLFGTRGKKTSMKMNMRQFNGFTFEVDSETYISRRQKMLRSNHSTICKICKMLKLMVGTQKPKMVDRILSFLNCPSNPETEELSSAGMSEDREDTESAPLQSEQDIDEVEVDQPNPSKGRGVKLGDIPWISDHISKMNRTDLKPLHTLLFGTPGKFLKTSMKKDMRQFNGFTFEVDSEPYIRRKKMLRCFPRTKLKVICKMLKLMVGHSSLPQWKPKMVNGILSFLNCPSNPETVPRMRKPPENTPIKKVLTRAPPKKRELDTESAPLQSERDIDEVEVDQPNPSKGRGVKLGDIPWISDHISKMNRTDLKPLHTLLFGTPGKFLKISMKKDMRQFNGFTFEVDSEPYIRRRQKMLRSLPSSIRKICKMLKLMVGTQKPKMVDRILSFLNCPSNPETEELSSAGMSEDREDTESAPLQSERDIDEVEVDQPNPSKGLREGILGEVLEGKRIKKTVERLNFQRHIIPKRYSKAENGRGVKLGDIPWISDHISKMHASDLEPLHILLFDTPGRKTSMKKDMRQFNGFTFEVDSEPYIRRRQKMLRSLFPVTKLKVICKILKLMVGTQKPKMVDRILSFLNCPSNPETGSSLLTRMDLTLPSKKNAVKKATQANTGFFLTYTNGSHTLTEESSEDDAPLITFKKKKRLVSNEHLIETVQKVLKEANLEEITMKQICQKVYDTYPDLDLTPRKDYIKETVKMIASALLLVSAGNRQESVPVNTQESVPVNTQVSVPVNRQESVPVNTQVSVPVNRQESVPVNTQVSVPVNTQESVPVNTQESAWRTRVENTPKSVPVIMNTDGWFEVERDT